MSFLLCFFFKVLMAIESLSVIFNAHLGIGFYSHAVIIIFGQAVLYLIGRRKKGELQHLNATVNN